MQAVDERGYFGNFGGQFVPEVLIEPLRVLTRAATLAFADSSFWTGFHKLLHEYVGRPTPLTVAHNLSASHGNVPIALKREDCNHTGAHKIVNALGQALLAHRMHKTRIIAETGAGQHGVAAATAGAMLGLPVEVHMGADDMSRQALNVYLMRLLGASVHEVRQGNRTLKEATSEALRDWAATANYTYYLVGSAVGAHPYPWIVRELVRVIGDEARAQCQTQLGRLPTDVVACVGGGSNAIGIFAAFLGDADVQLWGVEAAGRSTSLGDHAASLGLGSIGVLHGARTFVLQDEAGQIAATHSISAGLDYPGVGPEHAHLKETGRVRYVSVSDEEALAAFSHLARTQGIVPALESAHAVAFALRLAHDRMPSDCIVVNVSGRGDKDAVRLANPQPISQVSA